MDFPSINIVEVDYLQEAPPVELLQLFELVSLPLSQLTLKVGALIILIQNLYLKEGLCNSTCLVITQLRCCCLETQILTREFAGQLRVIPQIQLTSTEGELPFIITRRQFPVRPCFAMTVNKLQGQSLDVAGVDLRRAVFTHGQLYVAMSWVTSVEGLSVLLPSTAEPLAVENAVYPEVLL